MFLTLLALSACAVPSCCRGPWDPTYALLDSARIRQEICSGESCAGVEPTGLLAVSGADREWRLHLPGADVWVYSATQADLSSLDQREVNARLAQDSQGYTAMAVLDEEGLAWLVEPTDGALLTPELLGEDFIQFGQQVASSFVDADDYEITLYDAVIQTDDGPVTVTSGVVYAVTIGGLRYRFVLISAYQVATIPDGAYPLCGERQDMLSFELIRVDEEPAQRTISRKSAADWARAGCGDG